MVLSTYAYRNALLIILGGLGLAWVYLVVALHRERRGVACVFGGLE
jgi:hypothetical protein